MVLLGRTFGIKVNDPVKSILVANAINNRIFVRGKTDEKQLILLFVKTE